MIGEVSTENDDLHDNVFLNEDVGRYPQVEEDEPATVRLLSDRA
jgi:D-lyxose ketol-isomerase